MECHKQNFIYLTIPCVTQEYLLNKYHPCTGMFVHQHYSQQNTEVHSFVCDLTSTCL